jgi:DNA-binding MurR/RpiR family transcriptional regulator
MATPSNILNELNGMRTHLSATDGKIADVILAKPQAVVNMTISQLARQAEVSDASVSRFCKNINLHGFHELKIALARVAEDQDSYYQEITADNLQQSLRSIGVNKKAEIDGTLGMNNTATVNGILDLLQNASVIQVAAAGGTYPVAADAVYKFNQLGYLAFADAVWDSAVGQTMNLPRGSVLMVISNSGETADLIKQMQVARARGVQIIAITNRRDSPIGQAADWCMLTAVRQRILESEYYFSRVSAMTAVEALFLLLLARDKDRLTHIKAHEDIVARTKV